MNFYITCGCGNQFNAVGGELCYGKFVHFLCPKCYTSNILTVTIMPHLIDKEFYSQDIKKFFNELEEYSDKSEAIRKKKLQIYLLEKEIIKLENY